MAGGGGNRRGMITGINVTPLVDITLVLLIIFIVTAKIIVTPAVPMDLPKSSHGSNVQVVFSVLLPKDSPTMVNGTHVASLGALTAKAKEALGRDSDLRAVIQADGAVPHRRVIATMDAIKNAGVEKIAFGALPEDGEK